MSETLNELLFLRVSGEPRRATYPTAHEAKEQESDMAIKDQTQTLAECAALQERIVILRDATRNVKRELRNIKVENAFLVTENTELADENNKLRENSRRRGGVTRRKSK